MAKGLPLLLLLAGGACQPAPAARTELTLYAAASLRDALLELSAAAEAACSARVVLNLGSSGDLARQILAAGQADLFFSADEQELARVEAAGLVEPGTRRALLSNQLVVIEPAWGPSSFDEPFTADQLARVPLLALAQPETVPAGRYARAWLEARGLWSALAARVLPGVDVRAALAAVESGGARAGIVYRTDAARSRRVRIVHAVPTGEGPGIVYPLAVLSGPRTSSARALAAFLASPEAGAVFAAHGFVVLERDP